HLPILGKETYILISPPRFKCFDCPGKPITTQTPSWYTQRSPNTTVYENYIIMQLVNSTVSDVAHRENLGEDAIQGIIDRHISKKIDWNKVKSIPIVGLDEISLKKGHKDFVTIVTANIDGEITLLGVLEGNKRDTVKKFLLSIPSRLRKTVRVVCSDLHEGFINAAKEVFKSAKVTADRFHVAKLYRNCLEKLRKQEMKRLREELSEEEYKGLKGIMWILRKNPSKLENDELIKLEQLFKYSPELKTAYELSNGLTDIFNEKISKRRAKNKI
ncbi:MAG: ISL3 family transposase, partial [bacterium]|nr:ISL3 family transposase [bacterium]